MIPPVIAAVVAVAIVAPFVFVAVRHVLRQKRLAAAREKAFRRCRRLVHQARSAARAKTPAEMRLSVRYIQELKTLCADWKFTLEEIGTNRRQLDQIIFLTRDAILADPESVDPVAVRWRLNPDEPGTVTIEVNGAPETEDLEIVIPLDLPELPATTSLERVEAAMARDAFPLPDIEEVMAALDRLAAAGEVLTSNRIRAALPADWTRLKRIPSRRLTGFDVKTLRDSLPEHHAVDELFNRLIDAAPPDPGANGKTKTVAPPPVDFGRDDD